MNSIVIMGRLTAAPEIKTATNGKTVCTFTIAVDRKSKEKKTDFFPCVAFDKTAINIEQFFGKGNRILVRGQMQADQYEKDNKKMTYWKLLVNEFDFMDSHEQTMRDAGANMDLQNHANPADDDDFPF